jgi:hypothetical protein
MTFHQERASPAQNEDTLRAVYLKDKMPASFAVLAPLRQKSGSL